MIATLYGLGYITASIALLFWLLGAEIPKVAGPAKKVFFGAFLLFVISALMAPVSGTQKMWMLCRELLVLAFFASLVLLLLRRNRIYAYLLSAALLAYFVVFHFSFIKSSAGGSPELIVEVDPAAEILVQLRDREDAASLQEQFRQDNISFRPAFAMQDEGDTQLDNYLLADLPGTGSQDPAALLQRLQASTYVEWAELNEVISYDDPATAEAPQRSTVNYGVNDPQVQQQWALETFRMAEYYALLSKAPNNAKPLLLAILDTGVDAAHEDIKAQYQSTESRYDRDAKGHGTHCACIAGASTNNGIGIASLAGPQPLYRITSIQVLGDNGSGSQQTIIQGILKAADQGAQVISMSLGGFSNESRQRAYEQAISYARRKGAIIVAAAGNSNSDARRYSPANIEGIITVSAVDQQLQKASFSNTVDHVGMPIAAPGVSIFSCIPGNKYAPYNGTSMATPYVSGLVAVLKALRPGADTREIYEVLQSTGIDTRDSRRTGKCIQPAAALKAWLN